MTDFTPDKTMLNNYIQNKLSDTDTEQLELWLVDHPDVMQDLEMGVMFKQSDLDHMDSLIKPVTNSINWQNWFKLPSLILGAVAASLILVPILIRDIGATQSNLIYAQNEFIINNTRSSIGTTVINTSSRFISLKIPVHEEWLKDNDEFIVLLQDSNGEERSLTMSPNWDNELMISLQLNKLKNQKNKISVFSNDQVREKALLEHIIEIKVNIKEL